MTFTKQHDRDLEAFFSGALGARLSGVRSSMGAMLETAASIAVEREGPRTDARGWPIEFMPCRQTSSGASREATEIAMSMLSAVPKERRIRAALGELMPEHRAALVAFYVPRPSWSPHGLERLGELRAVIALLEDEERLRELAVVASRDVKSVELVARHRVREERTAANAALRALERAAELLLDRARDAYASAETIIALRDREQRLAAFSSRLGSVA